MTGREATRHPGRPGHLKSTGKHQSTPVSSTAMVAGPTGGKPDPRPPLPVRRPTTRT